MFFPLFEGIEIYPYWVLLIFLVNWQFKKLSIYIYSAIFIFILAFLKGIMISSFYKDFLQFTAIGIALYFFYQLNSSERNLFRNIIRYAIYFQFLFILFSYFDKDFQHFFYEIFSNRGIDGLKALDRNGAFTGFSPEPSYGASLIIGLWILISSEEDYFRKTKSGIDLTIVFLSLLFFKSVYGFIIFSLVSFYFFCFREMNYINRTFFTITNVFAIFGSYIDLEFLRPSLQRTWIFYESLINNFLTKQNSFENITSETFPNIVLDAERQASSNSTRFTAILNVLDFDKDSTYTKSISAPVFLINIFSFYFFFLVPIFIKLNSKNLKDVFKNSYLIVLAFFITPMLVWPYYTLFFKDEKNNY